jgi:hypothetical protein
MKKKICIECRGLCHICNNHKNNHKNNHITRTRRFSISLEKIIYKKKIAWKTHERHIGSMPSSSCESCSTICNKCKISCNYCEDRINCRGHGALGPSFYNYI